MYVCDCMGAHVCLSRVSMAVKRHHDHSNSYEEKYLTEVVTYSFRGSVSMVVCRNMWHWKSNWESATSRRQQEVSWNTKYRTSTFAPQWHASSSRVLPSLIKPRLLMCQLPMRLWGPVTFKLRQSACSGSRGGQRGCEGGIWCSVARVHGNWELQTELWSSKSFRFS